MKPCFAMWPLFFSLASCQCDGAIESRAECAAAMVEMKEVNIHRYRAGRLVLSASVDSLTAEDLANLWRAQGVRARVQPEVR